MIYNIDVAPNQYLQVSMQQPALANIDYDLYVGDVNWNTGTFYPEKMSAYGTYLNDYATGRNTIDESVGIINTTGATKTYYIAVQSSVGVSSQPFTLKVSLSAQRDGGETDESLFDGYYPGVGYTRTLSSPIDRDWYQIQISKQAEVQFGLGEQAAALGYDIEVYTLGSGNTLKLVQGMDNNTYLMQGNTPYYIRVLSDEQNFSNTISYTISADVLARTAIMSTNDGKYVLSKSGNDYYINGNLIDFTYSYYNGVNNAAGWINTYMNLYKQANQWIVERPLDGFEDFAPKIVNYTTNFEGAESRNEVLVLTIGDTLAQIRRYAGGDYAGEHKVYDRVDAQVVIDPSTGKIIDMLDPNFYYEYGNQSYRITKEHPVRFYN